jgi:hypothetical protein
VLEARALAAARAVALAHGLRCDDPLVLADHSNVLVHLRPAPVVARVMTGTAILHEDLEQWLTREVAVGAFLGERGLAVPPSDVLPPGPHLHDDLWLTFWRFVEHDRASPMPAASELGGCLRELHAALAGYPGELQSLSQVGDDIERLLGELRPAGRLTSAAIGSLRAALDELRATVFDCTHPAQALHGDVSISNLFRTEAGLVWNDLEDVFCGPVAWDVAGLVVSARMRGRDEAFVDAMLEAYGGPALEELEPFIAADELYSKIWQAFDSQRRV